MITMNECTRQNTLCRDCDDDVCIFAGEKWADCPKYYCDNPGGLGNCDNCDFIDDFIEEMRNAYRSD